MLNNSLKALGLCILLLSGASYAQQEISLDMRDTCVETIKPFYGDDYAKFLRGTRDRSTESLRKYYEDYLETYPKDNFSSLYSDVLQGLHEYSAGSHRLHYDIANLQTVDENYIPLVDLEYPYSPRVYGAEREDVTDEAERTSGQHALNLLCANKLNAKSVNLQAIRIYENNDLERYNKKKSKGGEALRKYIARNANRNESSNTYGDFRLPHTVKADVVKQKQEIQGHIDTITGYQDYLDNNDIDLSELLTFLRNRVEALTEAINTLTELGYE